MPRNLRSRPALCARIRATLLAIYGPRCAGCGCQEGDAHLEVNHLWGRAWKPREVSSYGRWLRYMHEAQLGLIDLRCPECNKQYRVRRDAPPSQPCPRFVAWLTSGSNQPF